MKDLLLKKIADKEIVVGVVGLGYVGLPLAVEKSKAGFKTIGFDVSLEKTSMINKGLNYISDVVDSDLKSMVNSGLLSATTDFSLIQEVDFIAICVPTPLDAHQQIDISYVENATKEISKYLTECTMVVLESTTYPGTTEELLKPILENGSGLKCCEGFYLGFSPERVDPGNAIYKTKNTPKVVGAVGEDAKDVISAMYRAVLEDCVHVVSSPAIAEMTKILENTYRNINIGLINELAILCNKMSINIWEVIEAAKTKPFGFTAFYPGPGLGGHCIPLDPYYLSWKAREYGFHTSMIEASMIVNDRMPEYTIERASKILNRLSKSMNGSQILVVGVAYKQDINDYRESPALKIIELLEKTGANVRFYDPYIPKYIFKGQWHNGETELSKELLESSDLVIIATAHNSLDYNQIQQHAVTVFDTKNAMSDVQVRTNIELL